eukprot:TRINITY_DN43529_c0_g1_i1.p2 TRINITY_DN43529_c0_g1~~TRINITY_DN43529_c0_g1_i1.p2  ORF type:complete len:183 (+),score=37.75 TRINITY_DN43529_c0_g1_i1:674-1222(+)
MSHMALDVDCAGVGDETVEINLLTQEEMDGRFHHDACDIGLLLAISALRQINALGKAEENGGSGCMYQVLHKMQRIAFYGHAQEMALSNTLEVIFDTTRGTPPRRYKVQVRSLEPEQEGRTWIDEEKPPERFEIMGVSQVTRYAKYMPCTPSGISAEFCVCGEADAPLPALTEKVFATRLWS